MTTPREVVIDRLHGRVRVSVLLIWLGTWAVLLIIGAVVASLAFSSQPAMFWLIWALASLWISQYPSRWAEGRLADRWPSGRRLTVTHEALKLTQPTGDVTLNRREPISRLTWCFKIQRQRGTRVTAGSYCLAVRWNQGSSAIVIYTFASAKESAELRANHGFYELVSSRDRSLKDQPVKSRGRDAAYLAAENERYENGGEVTFEDLSAVVEMMAVEPVA